MLSERRVFFIGGSSHAGKSTLAQSLASTIGWSYRSTDCGFAPHPGRPWADKLPVVPQHVAEHYRELSPNELIADVIRHYTETVWPLVVAFATLHATDPDADRIVLEGSALLPELVTTLALKNTAAIWLIANDSLFEKRIYQSSKYRSRTTTEKYLIDKFLARTQLFDRRIRNTVEELGLACIDIEEAATLEDLLTTALSVLGL